MKWLPHVAFNVVVIFAAATVLTSPTAAQNSEEPAMVKLTVQLVEVQGAANKTAGFDWYLGSAGPQGPAPELTPAPGSGPAGVWPSNSAQRQQTNSAGTLTGILTDPQFKVVMRALEQRDNARVLAAPEGVTLSGSPFALRRPDGWNVQIVPVVNASGEVTLALNISQEKGDYAGFHLTSQARVKSGETALFGDTFEIKEKKKNTTRRLFVTIAPTVVAR